MNMLTVAWDKKVSTTGKNFYTPVNCVDMLCTIFFFFWCYLFVFSLKATQENVLVQKTSTANAGFTRHGKSAMSVITLPKCFTSFARDKQVLAFQKTSC